MAARMTTSAAKITVCSATGRLDFTLLSRWLPPTTKMDEEALSFPELLAELAEDFEEPALAEPALLEAALEAVIFPPANRVPAVNSRVKLSSSPVSLFFSVRAVVPEKESSSV